MKRAKYISIALALAVLSSSAAAMGEGPQRINSASKPEFKGVSEREGFFSGTLKDDTATTNLTEISFGGMTSISNVLTDNDDSHNTLSLSEISEITIVDPIYHSPRHTKEPEDLFFIKTKVVIQKKDGAPSTSEFLFPVNLTISGKERDTDIKKAWRLRDISSLTIKKETPLSLKKELEKLNPQSEKAATTSTTTAVPVVHKPLWKIVLKPLFWLFDIFKRIVASFTSFLK